MRVECTNYISNNDNKNTLFTTINKVFTAVYTFLSSISDAHGFVLVGRESNNNIWLLNADAVKRQYGITRVNKMSRDWLKADFRKWNFSYRFKMSFLVGNY